MAFEPTTKNHQIWKNCETFALHISIPTKQSLSELSYSKEGNERFNAWEVSKYRVFSGSYFPAFGLNTKRYGASLRIQSEYGKIRTRKKSVFWHFSRSRLEVKKQSVWYESNVDLLDDCSALFSISEYHIE